MKVLVTGGGGFLGSYICRQLVSEGFDVTAFQRTDSQSLKAAGIRSVCGSIDDRDSLQRALVGCEAVVHTAAKAAVWGKKEDFFRVNVVGTRNLIQASLSAGVRYLVHTSTPSVVFDGCPIEGRGEDMPYGESIPSLYASSKVIAEREVLAASGDSLRTCALRPHLIWGVGDPHLVPRVLDRAARGRLMIVGKGDNRVDLTHVRNAAHAHILALKALVTGKAAGEAFFISDGDPVKLWEWINELLASLGKPRVERRIPAQAALAIGSMAESVWSLLPLSGEPPMTRFVATELAKSHWFSIEKARKLLGYTPVFSPSAGLEELISNLNTNLKASKA